MKKRFLSVILTAAMILSVSACGAEIEETTTENNVASITEDNNTETTKQTTTAKITETEKTEEEATNTTVAETTTEVTTTEVIEPTASKYASSNYFFENGSWFLCGSADEGDSKMYYYDLKEKTLIECKGNIDKIRYNNLGCLNIDSTFGVTIDNEIINIITGEVLYSSENEVWFINKDYYEDKIIDGKIAIIEKSESISGAAYSFGIVSVDGEWIVPMSNENAVAKDKECCESAFKQAYTNVFYSQDGNYVHINSENGCYSYSIADDTLLRNKLVLNGNTGYLNTINVGESNVLKTIAYSNGCELGTFDIKTGASELYVSASMLKGFYENNIVALNGTAVQVFDYDYNIKAEYDLSAYSDIVVAAVSDDYLFFSCCNSEGSQYVCLMNKNGEFEFEPFKGSVSYEKAHMTDDKLVYVDGDNTLIYYFDTKELVKPNNSDRYSEDYFSVIDYDISSDLLLVEVNRTDSDDEHYVLSDPDDITNVITPFEN